MVESPARTNLPLCWFGAGEAHEHKGNPMNGVYVVRQGDYLEKIAKDNGFSDYRAIYEHPQNADFRKLRPDPNLLYPGDKLFIPEKKPRVHQGATRQVHTFKVTVPRLKLHLCLHDDYGDPINIARYELDLSSKVLNRYATGEADPPSDRFDASNLGKGLVIEELSNAPTQATLRLWFEDPYSKKPDVVRTLQLGHLDPITTISGIQARLNNLGFNCGPADGKSGPRTRAAIKLFQSEHGIDADGEPNGATQSKLSEVYGC
jgi:LysM repeat protein